MCGVCRVVRGVWCVMFCVVVLCAALGSDEPWSALVRCRVRWCGEVWRGVGWGVVWCSVVWGLGCVVCGLRSVACGVLWRVVCGVWRVVNGGCVVLCVVVLCAALRCDVPWSALLWCGVP